MSHDRGAGRSPAADVVGLGVVVVDLLAVLDAYPHVDTKQDVRDSRVQVGGPVPTALAQLAKFEHRCTFLGCWGDDPFGDVVEADLNTTGVVFSPECRQQGIVTGHSQVWIERRTGHRTSVTQRPETGRMTLSPDDRRVLEAARLVHLDGWPSMLAAEAAQIAKSAGATVVVDTGSPKAGIEQLLQIADVVNAPRRFVEEVYGVNDIGEGAEVIADDGPSVVTVTDGERGAVIHAEGQLHRMPALRLPQVVDTNGAGDVFCAGLIHGVLAAWSPPRMLRFAMAAAAWKCQALGNRDALAEDRTIREMTRQCEVYSPD